MTADERQRVIADLQRQVAVLEAEVRALRRQMELVFERLDRRSVLTDAIGRVRLTGRFYSWIVMLFLVLVLLVASVVK